MKKLLINCFSTDSEMLKDVSRYTRQELEVACEDFSNIIDSSAESQIYKGTIKGGTEIAVISLCVKEENWTGYLELNFQREVLLLMVVYHQVTCKKTSVLNLILLIFIVSGCGFG